jgi:hypothetical protein
MISSSEVMHMSRVKHLLDRYGPPDPAAGQSVGVFTNPVLQQLYNDLMSLGGRPLRAALNAGVAIEEVDIADLPSYLKETNKADITNVYTSLMTASYHHLSASTNQLSQYPWSAGLEHSQRFSGRLPGEIDCLIHGQRLAL